MTQQRRTSFVLFLVLTMAAMIGMLHFGIRSKGYRLSNNVRWQSGEGLAFDRFALAYTNRFFPFLNGDSRGHGLAIEMAIEPVFSRYPDLIRFILLIHGSDDRNQLMIGQWRSSLIIMNGDDYSNARRTPKIYLKLDKYNKTLHLITIVSNEMGSKVFVDGRLAKKKQAMVLKYPNQGERARMTVGNSLSGKRPWIGTIFGLALYDRDLSDEIVRQHYKRWRQNRDFSAFRPEAPRLLYVFSEGKGEKIMNKIEDGYDLLVPTHMPLLHKSILSWPRFTRLGINSLAMDSMVNLAGFIPLGFLMIATLMQFDRVGFRSGIIITVLFVCLFSLFIELYQIWIPSRDSSLLDLISNTIGGAIGALLFRFFPKWSRLLRL